MTVLRNVPCFLEILAESALANEPDIKKQIFITGITEAETADRNLSHKKE